MEHGDDKCKVFLDVEVAGLQFTYFKVEHLRKEDDFKALIPEVVYRFDPESYILPNLMDEGKEKSKIESLVMEQDVKVQLTDGQTLRLNKITGILDPIILTHKKAAGEKSQTFKFSIESM